MCSLGTTPEPEELKERGGRELCEGARGKSSFRAGGGNAFVESKEHNKPRENVRTETGAGRAARARLWLVSKAVIGASA